MGEFIWCAEQVTQVSQIRDVLVIAVAQSPPTESDRSSSGWGRNSVVNCSVSNPDVNKIFKSRKMHGLQTNEFSVGLMVFFWI